MEIPSAFFVCLLLWAYILETIYIYVKNSILWNTKNNRMLINTNLMKEGTMQVPS
jgi:hypothetical protein